VGVIDAFKRAFAPEAGPVLVVKTVNGESREMDLEMVRYAAAGRTDVVVIDEPLSRPELGSLMEAADCYVSLHRSEGFGLTMAESMALGKPVIATAYSGNLDFMTDENSFLVPFSWALVPSGADPYPPGTRWAEPDLDAAAAIMRVVVGSPELAATVAERGREDIQRYHSLERRAEFVRGRFEAIERRRTTSGRRSKAAAPATAVAGRPEGASRSVAGSSSALRAVQLVAAGAGVAAAKMTGRNSAGSASRSGGAAFHRRAINRLLRPRPAGNSGDLGRSVADLAQDVQELRSVCISAHAKQSERDAVREQAIRDLGHRLDAIERKSGATGRT
jgi:hypothetical protein